MSRGLLAVDFETLLIIRVILYEQEISKSKPVVYCNANNLHTDILKGYSNNLAELHVPVNVATQLYITDCQSKYFLIE